MQCLAGYAWPGNVRELENLVERVSVCAEGDIIRLADLPIGVRAPHLGAVEVQQVRENLIPNDDTPIATMASVVSMSMGAEPRPIEAVAAELRDALRAAHAVAAGARAAAAALDSDATAGADDESAMISPPGATPTPALTLPIDLPTM